MSTHRSSQARALLAARARREHVADQGSDGQQPVRRFAGGLYAAIIFLVLLLMASPLLLGLVDKVLHP